MAAWVEGRAFPQALRGDVAALMPSLSAGQFGVPGMRVGQVVLHGERLDVPGRASYDADGLRHATSGNGLRNRIAPCLGTTHHDGYLRQTCAQRLLRSEDPWVAPFIVALVGQYVIEILLDIERALPAMSVAAYGGFVSENPAWMRTIGRRVTSYWDAYHRTDFADFDAYPGTTVFRTLQSFAASIPREAETASGR